LSKGVEDNIGVIGKGL